MSRMTKGERALPRQSRSASTQRVARPDARRRAGEERYRDGVRRTSAEPLQASWRPPTDPPADRRGKSRRRKGLAGLIRTYGWRIYALPVLLALTVLVVMDTVGRQGADARPAAAGQQNTDVANAAVPGETETPPEVTEQAPVPPVDLNIPTAELPNGGNFTAAGAGSWHIVPGSGEKIGSGRLFTYTVEVEDGVDASPYGGDDSFAKLIDETLADPRGWANAGKVSVQRVDASVANPSMRISLTTPETVHRPDRCGFAIKYESSCYQRADKRVMINLARWVRGAVAFGGDMLTYRQYAINHEVGHAFNNGHVGCATEDGLAPVMMQQTFGVANNVVAELNAAARNRDPVVADGKTCRPNAWPNPQAQPGG